MATQIYDQNGNVIRKIHFDDPNGDAVFETVEDVEPLLDEVKELAENHRQGGDMKHVARVPVTVVERAMREGWYHDEAKWRQFLNDPDNAYLRVWKGRV